MSPEIPPAPAAGASTNSSYTPPGLSPPRATTFQALRHRNFRLWFFGQLTSLVGTWMQSIAQNWLVYQLTGSASDLGLVNFVGAIPLVPLTLYAGAIADRFPKRRTIFAMQAVMMLLALALGLLSWTGSVRLWHVLVLAFLLGAAQAIDTPARQAFVVELVGKDDLANAIALNSGVFHGARVIGPALAGILVASVGVSGAFFLNSASFLAVLGGLALMDATLIRSVRAEGDEGRDLWGGARYILSHEAPKAVVLLVTLSALLAMPYYVLIPIFASKVHGGGAREYGILMSAAGVGAVLGSLYSASAMAVRRKGAMLTAGSLSFPFFLAAFALSRGRLLSLLLITIVGFAFVLQNAPANSLLQTIVPDALRGRVMAVYVCLFLSMMRIGGLLLGLLAAWTSAPTALVVSSAASLAAALFVSLRFPALRRME